MINQPSVKIISLGCYLELSSKMIFAYRQNTFHISEMNQYRMMKVSPLCSLRNYLPFCTIHVEADLINQPCVKFATFRFYLELLSKIIQYVSYLLNESR